MKLVYKVILTLIIPLILTLGVWGWLSYKTMSEKIHDDTDMILKEYSDNIIMRLLSGKELPDRFNGAYNTYYIENIDQETAESCPAVEYGDAEIFLKSQEDFAGSRTRSQIFTDNEGNYRKLTVSMPTFEQDVLMEHVLWWTILLFAVLLVSLIFLGAVLVNYNMRPLHRLLKWIDEYEPGVQQSDLPSDTDILEFRKLTSAVEDAVARFEAQYEERKIFIGNASHELQTPLAVCSNRLEILLDRSDLNEEIAEELVKIHRHLSGLIRLNKTMLLLSKIENGQFPQTSEVDMSDVIRSAIELYTDIYSYKNINLSVNESEKFRLHIDEQMASVLVGNLIKNAYIYTPEDGSVSVTICNSGFSVSNSGDSSLDKDQVFRRFYQPSGRREGATGLGLALVYSVCAANGLDVIYGFKDGRHHFDVTLKN